jgi:hypothetical protein
VTQWKSQSLVTEFHKMTLFQVHVPHKGSACCNYFKIWDFHCNAFNTCFMCGLQLRMPRLTGTTL